MPPVAECNSTVAGTPRSTLILLMGEWFAFPSPVVERQKNQCNTVYGLPNIKKKKKFLNYIFVCRLALDNLKLLTPLFPGPI